MKEFNVLVLMYPGCISFEVALAAEILSQKFGIVVATPDGEDLNEQSGLPVKTLLSFANVDLRNCRCVLVPGGDPGSIFENTQVDQILQQANERKILIGAICAGPSLLGKAGILRGRNIAHGYGQEQLDFLREVFRDVTLTEEMVVIDGNIITARPDAYIDFAVEIACRLEVRSASQATKLKDYYRGILGRKIRPVALAMIVNGRGQMLLQQLYDSVKKEHFYRALGGGIEFHESAAVTIAREIREELDVDVVVGKRMDVVENIFVHEGRPGHEFVWIYEAKFVDRSNYQRIDFDVVESGHVISKAVWRSAEEIQAEGAKLYPAEFAGLLV